MKRVNNLSIFLIFLIFFSILWGDTNFKQRFSINLKGNLRVIGNTILKYDGAIGNRTNDDLNLLYVDIDNNSSTFNSSSATIEKINSGIDISKAKIVWAGLYWQSYLHTWDKNDIGDKNNRFTDITTPEDIEEIIKNHKIRFTTPYGVYEIKAQEIKSYVTLNDSAFGWNAPGYHKYNYSCFADVTYLLKGKSPVGEYTVGNIPAQQGQTDKFEGMSYGGLKWFDGLGNYGAWVLVVVYDNKEALLEKTRNVTIFDGFTLISGFGHPQEVIHLYGFKTPKEAPQGVDSTISIFAAEGDKNILGDYARLINQNGAVLELPNAPGTDSYFASAIEGVDIRNPKYENNNGIDIHTTQVGTKGGNEPGRIGPNQTSAALEIGTATSGNARDAFMPSMVAFSTELYMPKLCYDYDLRIGKFLKIASNNREFNVTKWGDDPLELTIFLRSETTDFPIEHTKIRVTFDPDKLEYIPNSSKVSPDGINFYIPVPDIDNKGLVPIGRELTKEGGIIDAKESTYIKQDFKLKDIYYKGKFDIEVIGTIQYDKKAKPVPFLYSTKFPEGSPYHLPRCNTNPIYDPMWGEFNIERDDSDKYSSSNKGMRYSLYTQVAGKGF
ncbi:MAG: hypothetical protein GXO02_03860, partial [Epsilonproteobacteria bacterium]|nr:hypothetical protein [Campylobacterota bacterium]